MRRWIATARSNSISCSVTAFDSASHGSGARRTRSSGIARTALPITGSSRNSSWNGRRSSSTAVAKRSRRIPHIASGSEPARAPKITRSGAGWMTATWTGAPSRCRSRWSDAPRRRISPSADPPRRRNGHGGRTSTRSSWCTPRLIPGRAAVARPSASRRKLRAFRGCVGSVRAAAELRAFRGVFACRGGQLSRRYPTRRNARRRARDDDVAIRRERRRRRRAARQPPRSGPLLDAAVDVAGGVVPPHQVHVDQERVATPTISPIAPFFRRRRRDGRYRRRATTAAVAAPATKPVDASRRSPRRALPSRRRRDGLPRRRATTAAVAAPATKPVAASAATWTAGTARPQRLWDRGGLGGDGQAVDDLALARCRVRCSLGPPAYGPRGRLQRARFSGGVPKTWSQ